MRYTPYVNTAESDRCRHDHSSAHPSLRSLGSARVIYALQRRRIYCHQSYSMTTVVI